MKYIISVLKDNALISSLVVGVIVLIILFYLSYRLYLFTTKTIVKSTVSAKDAKTVDVLERYAGDIDDDENLEEEDEITDTELPPDDVAEITDPKLREALLLHEGNNSENEKSESTVEGGGEIIFKSANEEKIKILLGIDEEKKDAVDRIKKSSFGSK